MVEITECWLWVLHPPCQSPSRAARSCQLRHLAGPSSLCWLFLLSGSGVLLTKKGRLRWCKAQLEESTRHRHEDEMAGTNFTVQRALLLGRAVLWGSALYGTGRTVLSALLLPFLLSPSSLLLSPGDRMAPHIAELKSGIQPHIVIQ